MSIMTGTQAPAPAAPAAPPAEAPTPDNGRQRLLLLAGGGLALVVVAALAYFFLLSGGSDTPAASVPLPAAGAGSTPSASASASAPAVAPLKSFAGKTARNPFKVLIPAQTSGGTTSGSTSTGSGTTATGTGTTTGTGTGTTAGTGTTTGATSTVALSSVPLAVSLKSTNGTSSASIWVKNTSTGKTAKYTPSIGDAFGTYFRLTGFVADSAGHKGVLVEYGDTILTLVVGDTSTVK